MAPLSVDYLAAREPEQALHILHIVASHQYFPIIACANLQFRDLNSSGLGSGVGDTDAVPFTVTTAGSEVAHLVDNGAITIDPAVTAAFRAGAVAAFGATPSNLQSVKGKQHFIASAQTRPERDSCAKLCCITLHAVCLACNDGDAM